MKGINGGELLGPYKFHRKWHVRMIRNGRVRIMGHEWAPSEEYLAYDGRLDGLRMMFGTYACLDSVGAVYFERFMEMWGTEEQAKRLNSLDLPEPHRVGDYYPWSTWRVVEAKP